MWSRDTRSASVRCCHRILSDGLNVVFVVVVFILILLASFLFFLHPLISILLARETERLRRATILLDGNPTPVEEADVAIKKVAPFDGEDGALLGLLQRLLLQLGFMAALKKLLELAGETHSCVRLARLL